MARSASCRPTWRRLVILLALTATVFPLAHGAAPEVRTGKGVYAPGEVITVFYSNLPGNTNDWITVVTADTPAGRYRQWTYLRGSTDGSFDFNGLPAGDYEARLHLNGAHTEPDAVHAFRIGEPAATTAAAPARPAPAREPQGPVAPAPARARATADPGAPAASPPLAPEFHRLVGTWIAHTQCGDAGPRGRRAQRLMLTVRASSSGTPTAEVRGIDNTAGIALDVTFDRESARYELGFAGWVPGSGYETNPYGLELAFLDDSELLHGQITVRDDCAAVVAGRVPEDNAAPNPNGLLYRVAVNRVLEPLSEVQCASYARWLASGEYTDWGGTWGTSAVTDGAAMRQVLGHDLQSWSDEDTRKIQVIHRTCHQTLKAATDLELLQLAAHERIWRGIPPPLSRSRTKYPTGWRDAYFQLYEPLVADILRTWELADEGLLTPRPAAPAMLPGERSMLAGEWRGYFECDGGNDAFMRLTFPEADADPLDVTLELGSGLKSIHPYGRLALAGRFDTAAATVSLEPQRWIEAPRGQVLPMGLNGEVDAAGEVISGTISGSATCKAFSVHRRDLTRHPGNPGGLLFKVLDRRTVTATVDDCRSYAQWLADGDEIKLGSSFFFSGLRDAERMRATLGKDLDNWGTDDHLKLMALSRQCQSLLEAQVDVEISELLSQIKVKKLVWAPNPLGVPRQGNTLSHWLRAEQLVMMNQRHQALAQVKLTQAAAFEPVIVSIDAVDALSKEGARRAGGVLEYLSEAERESYLASLRDRRVAVSVAAANVIADGWRAQPQSFEALQAVDASYQDSDKQLAARNASEGVATLNEAFRRESDERADGLWPQVIQVTADHLRALAAADLLRFPELKENQTRQAYLTTFHRPGSADAYFGDYQAASDLYRQTVERMVERSTSQILAWIEALPPSAGANRLLETFANEVFGTAVFPERHPVLARAATAKRQAYNPDRYMRPDIVMSLLRGQWNEVGLISLEDVAYLTTSLRSIKAQCPRVVPSESPALAGFAFGLAQQAVTRIMQGQVRSRAEAERAMWLVLNNVFNAPGCRMDAFGNITGCVSESDHAAAQEFFMTSSEAVFDMRTLLGHGCGAEGAGAYITGLVTYAEAWPQRLPSPPVRDFWSSMRLASGSPQATMRPFAG